MLNHLEAIFHEVREFLLNEGRSMTKEHGKNPKGEITKEFDLGAEDVVIKYCKEKKLPVEILTEERDKIRISNTPEWIFIIDPVDGSSNFLRGIENVGFSIAVLPYGKLLLDNVKYALIGDVFSGTVYKSEVGNGSFCDGKKITTSKKTELSKSLLFFGSHAITFKDSMPLINKINCVRVLGSASLDLACVAKGSGEGCILRNIALENFAAAYLIIKEAGGMFTDIHNNKLPEMEMNKGYDIFASGNKKIHEQIVELLKSCIPPYSCGG